MKKFLGTLLCCLLLTATVLSLVACPNSAGPTPGPNPTPGPGEEDDWADGIGELNCEGDSILVSCFSPYSYEIYGTEDGNWIENEIYKRNLALENRFNAKIENDTIVASGVNDETSHFNAVSRAFTNSNVEFDLLAMYAYHYGKLITQSYFCDWRAEIPYCSDSIKAKNEWWPESINLGCTVNGYQFVAISDLCLTAMEMCDAMVFNQELSGAYNIPSKITSTSTGRPYDTMYNVVRGGDWTLDNFNTVTKDFYIPSTTHQSDTPDLTDVYGAHLRSKDSFCYSCDIHYIENDGVNEPELWTVNTRVTTAIEKLRQILASTGCVKNNLFSDISYTVTIDFFSQGHSLFSTMSLIDLKDARMHQMENNAENPFGVLPYPKYDVNQTEYKTGSRDYYTALAVPAELLDYDEPHRKTVGALIEAMSAYTCRNVKNEYYKVIITHNNTHDAESVEMIDLVVKGRMYDLATYHYEDLPMTGGSLGLFFRYMFNNADKQPTQYWDAESEKVREEFDELITKYNEITD